MTSDSMKYFAIDYHSPLNHCERLFFPAIDDYIPNQIKKRGTFYEVALLEHLARFCPPDNIVVDVGANIGNHSLFFAKYLSRKVISFEPDPQSFVILESLIRKNNLDNVACIQCAVGEFQGAVEMAVPHTLNVNRGMCRIVTTPHPYDDSNEIVIVQIDTLDALLNAALTGDDKISLIKIDVEGHEEQVIKGAIRTIRKHRPHIVVEASDRAHFDLVNRLLTREHYRLFGCFCGTPTYHYVPWSSCYFVCQKLRKVCQKLRKVCQKLRKWVVAQQRGGRP